MKKEKRMPLCCGDGSLEATQHRLISICRLEHRRSVGSVQQQLIFPGHIIIVHRDIASISGADYRLVRTLKKIPLAHATN